MASRRHVARSQMTDEHKAALAVGRNEGRSRPQLPRCAREQTSRSGGASARRIPSRSGSADRRRAGRRRPAERAEAHAGAHGPAAGARRRWAPRSGPRPGSRASSSRWPRATATGRASATQRGESVGVPAAVLKKAGVSRWRLTLGRQQAGQHRGRRRSSPAARGVARSGCGIRPTTLRPARAHAGDVVDRPVGVVDVAEHDLLVGRSSANVASG